MFDLDRWQEIWHTLSKNMLRTSLTAFGVIWGILMMVIMLGAGKGLQNGTKKEFGTYASNQFAVWGQTTSKSYKGFQRGRRIRFTNDDIEAISDVPELDVISPRNQLGGYSDNNSVTRKSKSGAFNVMGDYPQIKKINLLQMESGRFLNQLDITDKRKVAVIGQRVKDVLFEEGENPVGENIEIRGVWFRVVGVFTFSGEGQRVEKEENTIMIPFTTYQKAFNAMNQVHWFSLTAKSNTPASIPESKVLDILKKRHNIAPEDVRALGHFNAEERFGEMNMAFVGINAISWFVSICTLLAGVIGVSNIMLVIIRERTKEIGIRRAMGATPWNIIAQIMTESVVLTSVSGYLGLVLGVGLLEAATALGLSGKFFSNPQVDFQVAVTALIILVVSGMIAGLIPAKRAVNIRPVDALRT